MIVGYAGFYLIRNNIALAIPKMQAEFGYTNFQIGCVLTVAYLVYGFGKGISGIFSDRSNARYFMTIGLALSCAMNFLMGFSSSLYLLAVIWALNAVFQSMGWPACARLLTHWFTKEEIGTKWALWNTSQQIGMLAMYILAAYALYIQNWRYIFFMPACTTLLIIAYIFVRLRDTPESIGFSSVKLASVKKEPQSEEVTPSFTELLLDKVYTNPLMWMICFANFFLYFVRMSILNWAPKFLIEFKGNGDLACITHTSSAEFAGMLGGIFAGYLSDRFFKGERSCVSAIFMLCVTFIIFLLWKVPLHTSFIQFGLMMGIGFFISGPQILIGVAATDFATKRAAGAASGLTGVFGYLGSALTGMGSGWVLDQFGWHYFFLMMIVAGTISSMLLICTWFVQYYRGIASKYRSDQSSVQV